jgi:hypothetical protein
MRRDRESAILVRATLRWLDGRERLSPDERDDDAIRNGSASADAALAYTLK